MARILRFLFYAVLVRLVVLIVLGLNVRHRERLPAGGPAILVANHNSHLDTLVLMTLMPLRLLPRLRPVAAADYFLRNRLFAWFALNVVGILPIHRSAGGRHDDPLQSCREALDRGDILILFPEGSRGDPERLTRFKSGIAHLALSRPQVPVFPVFLHGLGKALPRGEALLVPFFCDVFVGERLPVSDDRRQYMQALDARMEALAAEVRLPSWE